MKTDNNYAPSFNNEPPFAEIDMGEVIQPIPSQATPPSQTVPERAFDPLRARFRDMRLIENYSPYSYKNDSWLFYEQARFMADVEDDHPHRTAFSAFYPYYQRMGYEQLRTYFTWRTQVRSGNYPFVGASYLFLYIYELISCIGTTDAMDALTKLKALHPIYREAVPALDQYLPQWIADFYIYYSIEGDIPIIKTRKNDKEMEAVTLDMWIKYAAYKVTKSKFYVGNEALVTDCISAVFTMLETWCTSFDTSFEDWILYDGIKQDGYWKPFAQALFYPWEQQPDRQVVLPNGITYICRSNEWTIAKKRRFSGALELAGYIIKKTELILRIIYKFKGKFVVDNQTLRRDSHEKMRKYGMTFESLDNAITQAVHGFLQELNKVEVAVDPQTLQKIRKEAQKTQVKLTVEEEAITPITPIMSTPPPLVANTNINSWHVFYDALNDIEREALQLLLQGGDESALKTLANTHHTMYEVLVEGINEKAYDLIGDNLLDEDAAIYEDYLLDVKNLTDGPSTKL